MGEFASLSILETFVIVAAIISIVVAIVAIAFTLWEKYDRDYLV